MIKRISPGDVSRGYLGSQARGSLGQDFSSQQYRHLGCDNSWSWGAVRGTVEHSAASRASNPLDSIRAHISTPSVTTNQKYLQVLLFITMRAKTPPNENLWVGFVLGSEFLQFLSHSIKTIHLFFKFPY